MPQTPLTFRGRRGRWQTLSTYPYGECWVDSKASRVKCTTSSPLTPLHLRGGSKTNRSGRSWKPVKALRSNRVAAWPLQVGGDPTLVGKGAGGFPCTPATWRTWGVGQRPTVLTSPLGARSRGMCQRHSFEGLCFYSFTAFVLQRCSKYTLQPRGYAALASCAAYCSLAALLFNDL